MSPWLFGLYWLLIVVSGNTGQSHIGHAASVAMLLLIVSIGMYLWLDKTMPKEEVETSMGLTKAVTSVFTFDNGIILVAVITLLVIITDIISTF